MGNKIDIPTPPQREHLEAAQSVIDIHTENGDVRNLKRTATHLNRRAEQLEKKGFHSEAGIVADLGRIASDNLQDI